MKKIFSLFLLGIFIIGCNDDDYSSENLNVISDSQDVPFKEIIFLVNLKTNDSTYVVVKEIDSINIYVNTFSWAKLNSASIDTTKISKFIVNNRFESNNKISYLVVAKQALTQSNFNTAGDYAQYLNSLYELQPGEYACLIESFQITLNDSTTVKYYPYSYKSFRVESNMRSVFIGEFDINID